MIVLVALALLVLLVGAGETAFEKALRLLDQHPKAVKWLAVRTAGALVLAGGLLMSMPEFAAIGLTLLVLLGGIPLSFSSVRSRIGCWLSRLDAAT